MIKTAEKELQRAILVHNTRVSENQAAKRKMEVLQEVEEEIKKGYTAPDECPPHELT